MDIKKKNMFQIPYKVNVLFCIVNLIYFLPISIILGNAIINLNVLIIDALFVFLLFKKKLFAKYKNYLLFFIIFFILLFINTIFSTQQFLSFKSLLGILRYFILFLAICYSLSEYKNFENNFSKICFVVLSFVLFDTLVQFFFKKIYLGI